MCKCIGDEFTRRPLDQWRPEDDGSVTFSCRHPNATAGVGFLINGTGASEVPLPMGISTNVIILANGSQVSTITIPALSEYNGTVVSCLATLSNELCLVNGTLWIIGVSIALLKGALFLVLHVFLSL